MTESTQRQVSVDADDLDATVNLVERLRVTPLSNPLARWNTLPESERQAFERLRQVADHAD